MKPCYFASPVLGRRSVRSEVEAPDAGQAWHDAGQVRAGDGGPLRAAGTGLGRVPAKEGRTRNTLFFFLLLLLIHF